VALRSSWEGFLRLSLISIPVRAYNTAMPGRGEIHFHQLHRECGSRIRYAKMCPIHGEVSKDEIVSGYEHKKGEYVEIEKEELTGLRLDNEKDINIDAFLSPEDVNPIYYSGKALFLAPAGPPGQKPYALLHDVMKERNRFAIGTVVLSGHDEIVMIQPIDDLLAMMVLYHEEQVKHASAFKDEIKSAKPTGKELQLATMLVDESTPKSFDFGQYKDQYTERVSEALEAKLDGKKVRAPKKEKAPRVINLMDALRKSLGQERSGPKPARHRRPRAKKKSA
jgi:DNA end-binding protein Ku